MDVESIKIYKPKTIFSNCKYKKEMNPTNQSTIIKKCIESLLDKGMTDKHDIYSKVVEELGVPRPVVRRCARDLRNEMENKVKILETELDQMQSNQNISG